MYFQAGVFVLKFLNSWVFWPGAKRRVSSESFSEHIWIQSGLRSWERRRRFRTGWTTRQEPQTPMESVRGSAPPSSRRPSTTHITRVRIALLFDISLTSALLSFWTGFYRFLSNSILGFEFISFLSSSFFFFETILVTFSPYASAYPGGNIDLLIKFTFLRIIILISLHFNNHI